MAGVHWDSTVELGSPERPTTAEDATPRTKLLRSKSTADAYQTNMHRRYLFSHAKQRVRILKVKEPRDDNPACTMKQAFRAVTNTTREMLAATNVTALIQNTCVKKRVAAAMTSVAVAIFNGPAHEVRQALAAGRSEIEHQGRLANIDVDEYLDRIRMVDDLLTEHEFSYGEMQKTLRATTAVEREKRKRRPLKPLKATALATKARAQAHGFEVAARELKAALIGLAFTDLKEPDALAETAWNELLAWLRNGEEAANVQEQLEKRMLDAFVDEANAAALENDLRLWGVADEDLERVTQILRTKTLNSFSSVAVQRIGKDAESLQVRLRSFADEHEPEVGAEMPKDAAVAGRGACPSIRLLVAMRRQAAKAHASLPAAPEVAPDLRHIVGFFTSQKQETVLARLKDLALLTTGAISERYGSADEFAEAFCRQDISRSACASPEVSVHGRTAKLFAPTLGTVEEELAQALSRKASAESHGKDEGADITGVLKEMYVKSQLLELEGLIAKEEDDDVLQRLVSQRKELASTSRGWTAASAVRKFLSTKVTAIEGLERSSRSRRESANDLPAVSEELAGNDWPQELLGRWQESRSLRQRCCNRSAAWLQQYAHEPSTEGVSRDPSVATLSMSLSQSTWCSSDSPRVLLPRMLGRAQADRCRSKKTFFVLSDHYVSPHSASLCRRAAERASKDLGSVHGPTALPGLGSLRM